jgi:hypothetical protein
MFNLPGCTTPITPRWLHYSVRGNIDQTVRLVVKVPSDYSTPREVVYIYIHTIYIYTHNIYVQPRAQKGREGIHAGYISKYIYGSPCGAVRPRPQIETRTNTKSRWDARVEHAQCFIGVVITQTTKGHTTSICIMYISCIYMGRWTG